MSKKSKKKARHSISSDSTEYRKGYQDGMQQAFEESELDAYYAGVGYGKMAAGDKHIGFNNAEERRQFELGIAKRDNHFRAYRVKKLSWWEKLFGVETSRRSAIDTPNKPRKSTYKKSRKVYKQRENTKNSLYRLAGSNSSQSSGSRNYRRSSNPRNLPGYKK